MKRSPFGLAFIVILCLAAFLAANQEVWGQSSSIFLGRTGTNISVEQTTVDVIIHWNPQENTLRQYAATADISTGYIVIDAYVSRDSGGYWRINVGHTGQALNANKAGIAIPKSQVPSGYNYLWISYRVSIGNRWFEPVWEMLFGDSGGLRSAWGIP